MHYPTASTNSINGLGNDTVAERRAQIEQAESIVRAERQMQLQAQRSILSTAHQRICLWEKLHRLHLPSNANHKLLAIIAKETELTLDDVQLEQSRRNARKTAVAGV